MAKTKQFKPEFIPFTMADGSIRWQNPFTIDHIDDKGDHYLLFQIRGEEAYRVPKGVGDNDAGINSIE